MSNLLKFIQIQLVHSVIKRHGRNKNRKITRRFRISCEFTAVSAGWRHESMLCWEVKWFYSVANKPVGPVTRAELESLFEAGTITTSTLIVQEGMPDWFPFVNLKKTTQFLPAMAEVPAMETKQELKD